MSEAYLKQLTVDGSGAFTVCRIETDSAEALAAKRDIYIADGWQDSSVGEYTAQFANRTAPVEGEADKALGETAPEAAPETPTPAATEPEAETAPSPEA